MANHKFHIGISENGVQVGVECVRCSQIVSFENGKIPDEFKTQECPREDVNQAATRVVRGATEGD